MVESETSAEMAEIMMAPENGRGRSLEILRELKTLGATVTIPDNANGTETTLNTLTPASIKLETRNILPVVEIGAAALTTGTAIWEIFKKLTEYVSINEGDLEIKIGEQKFRLKDLFSGKFFEAIFDVFRSEEKRRQIFTETLAKHELAMHIDATKLVSLLKDGGMTDDIDISDAVAHLKQEHRNNRPKL